MPKLKIKILKSPNYSKKKRKISKIKYLIIHYTGMQSERVSIDRLLNKQHKVSCHYLISRNGNIIQMVNDDNVAWHAGKSMWKTVTNLNEDSIGIELVNKGHSLGYENFSKKQIKILINLCLFLKKKYKINKLNILGHSDIAPLRKKDPGEKFPWFELSKRGIGKWNLNIEKKTRDLSMKKIRNLFFKNLYKIGYRYFHLKKPSLKDIFIIKAFQMRYLPTKVSGLIDENTLNISHYLANNSKN